MSDLSLPSSPTSLLRDLVRRNLSKLRIVYDAALIEDTITLARKALALSSESGADRVDACLLLASSLRQRSAHHVDDSLLDHIISLERRALALCGQGHMERSRCCTHLAISLWTRYELTGDLRLLDETITLEREALDLDPEGHPNHSLSCGNLAISLKTRYERTGDLCLLDEAINLKRKAFSLRPIGHPDRSSSCEALALSLKRRYERIGDITLLDEAIDLEREAFSLRPRGHPDRSSSCLNLAASLGTRYQRTGDVDLLYEAISLERAALDLHPKGHPDRSTSCGNLAVSMRMRYEYTGNFSHLDEAINHEREALDLRPEGHQCRSISCGNLAVSLMTRYEHTENVDLLDEAINHEREALDLCPEGHPCRSISCGNLAASLKKRYQRTGDEALLHEMSALLQEALTIAHKHEAWRFAVNLAWMHLHVTGPFYSVNKAISYLSYILGSEHDDIRNVVATLKKLIDKVWICDPEGKHVELITIYRGLVNLLPLLAHPALGIELQLQAMEGCARLGSEAFVNAALAGDCSSSLEALELAQSVIWSQSLHRRDPQLKDVPEPLADRLQELLHAMAMNSAAKSHHGEAAVASKQHDALHANSSLLFTLMREIRAVPGLDRFMLGETFETLCTVTSIHPVVVVVSARGQHYALIMAKSLVQRHVLISLDLSDDDLANLSFGYGSKRAHRSSATPEETPEGDRAGFKKTADASTGPLDGQLRTLWHKVVKPVLEHLSLEPSRGYERPRLHWCPTGIFSNLPLHAAGVYDGPRKICCSDLVVSTYTPTITALLRAQRTTTSLERDDVSLVLVAEKRALQRSLEIIPGVEEEIDLVTAVAKQGNIKNTHRSVGSTTVAGTSALIQTKNIVHLACHGVQDSRDATQSGFCLGDGRLTIAGLMELKLDTAFLTFLSACETAKGDKNQPDQSMHLVAAMLFSRFKSVIATMWAISDIEGPKVAKWFYEELFSKEKIDADSIAYALDSAVGKLRDSGVSPDKWAPFIHMGA